MSYHSLSGTESGVVDCFAVVEIGFVLSETEEADNSESAVVADGFEFVATELGDFEVDAEMFVGCGG